MIINSDTALKVRWQNNKLHVRSDVKISVDIHEMEDVEAGN